jgi:hypothetical protein
MTVFAANLHQVLSALALKALSVYPLPTLWMHQSRPGNKGRTTTPTAAVVLTLFSPVMLVQLRIDNTAVHHIHGVQPHPLLICDALGIDHTCYEVPGQQENSACMSYPLERAMSGYLSGYSGGS